jgi:hypothetical protein
MPAETIFCIRSNLSLHRLLAFIDVRYALGLPWSVRHVFQKLAASSKQSVAAPHRSPSKQQAERERTSRARQLIVAIDR